jgi:hypothetical protein
VCLDTHMGEALRVTHNALRVTRETETMSVKLDNLPSRVTGEFLHCLKCGGEYSATRGDYFWMPVDQPFECRGQYGAYHRPVRLQLVRRISFLEVAS